MLREHGDSPESVGWCAANQAKRFAALTEGWDLSKSILDVGSGLAHLYDWLTDHADGKAIRYRGVDLLEEYVKAANIRLGSRLTQQLDAEVDLLPECDYAVASGLFNVKLGDYGNRNQKLLSNVVANMLASARIGVSFDCLLDTHPYRIDRQFYYRYAWLSEIFQDIARYHKSSVNLTDAGLPGNMIVRISKQPKEAEHADHRHISEVRREDSR